jgi:hypothetical protein
MIVSVPTLKKPLLALAYLTLLVVASFVSLEVGFRFLENPAESGLVYQLNDEHHMPKPYVMAAAKPFTRYHGIGHNILGYRDSLPGLPKVSTEYRVFLLGGSTVHGERVPLSEILNSMKIKHAGQTLHFYNFGAGSSISRQDLVRILIDLSGYAPDLIVHYGGGNDLEEIDPRINYPHRFVLYEKNFLFNRRSDWGDIFLFLATRSRVINRVFRQKIAAAFKGDAASVFTDKTNLNRYRVVAYWANLSWMQTITSSIGVGFMAIFQPVNAFKVIRTVEEDRLITAATAKERVEQRALYRKLIVSKRSKHISSFDCSEVFDGFQGQAFYDPIHLTEEAQQAAAGCIRDRVQQYLRSAPQGTPKPSPPVLIPEDIFVKGVAHFDDWLKIFAGIEP